MTQKIEGYGKASNGKVVHLVISGTTARCDKRATGIIADKKFKAKDVSCSKCKQYAILKELLKEEESPERKAEEIASAADAKAKAKTKPKEKPKAKPKTKAKPSKDAKPNAKPDTQPETNGITTGRKKAGHHIPEKSLSHYKKKEEEKAAVPKAISDKQFEAIVASDEESWNIRHITSQKVFFEFIPSEIADQALELLNEIDELYVPGSGIPKDFITKCRRAVIKAYAENHVRLPKTLEQRKEKKGKEKSKPAPEKKEKKLRTITRRKKEKEPKKEAKTITRRKKKEKEPKARTITRRDPITKFFGRRPGTPGYDILELIAAGPKTMNEISEILVQEHGMSRKKAVGRVKGCIRKTVRVQNGKVLHVLNKDVMDDTFQLVIPDNWK